jgi:glycosyl transferase family 25
MENIDSVYFINLDHRTDRLSEFTDQSKAYFTNTPVIRFPAILGGALGCTKSHLEVLKLAKSKGEKYIIIFEDDFEFLVSKDVFEDQIKLLFDLKKNDSDFDFKVVMLSYYSVSTQEYNSFLDKTTNAQTCSGYLLNCDYINELIECWEEAVKLLALTGAHWLYISDQSWKVLQKEKWFLFKTRIGKQRASYSDLGSRFIDYGI